MEDKKIKAGNPFASLKHKNFRYYWIGMCISLVGTWMQNIAQPWLAYRLTDSPFWLSVISALQFAPMLVISLFAGVLVDKIPKKRILIISQASFLILTMVLAILTWTGLIRYWHLVITALLMGIVNAFDMPARQSFVVELVGKEDLMNGIALNSTAFNGARIIGPAIAGLVMGAFGPALCFFINSISYAAVLISLFFVKPYVIEKPPAKKEGIFKQIGDGLKYIYKSEILFSTVLIMIVVGIFANNFTVLVPVFAVKILNQQETGYGVLMSFMGVGCLIASLLVATFSQTGPKKFIMRVVPLIVAASLIIIGFSRSFFLTGIILLINGFFFAGIIAIANSTMQLNTTGEYIGRVMSVYSIVFIGSTPIGNLYAGAISNRFGAAVGFIACGAIIILLMIPVYIYLKRKAVKQTLDAAGPR